MLNGIETKLGEPKWITNDKGKHVALYDGLSDVECYMVREYHRDYSLWLIHIVNCTKLELIIKI